MTNHVTAIGSIGSQLFLSINFENLVILHQLYFSFNVKIF